MEQQRQSYDFGSALLVKQTNMAYKYLSRDVLAGFDKYKVRDKNIWSRNRQFSC